MPAARLFEELVLEIEQEYSRLGHSLGWRFLNVSRRILEAPVSIALVTINPAGNEIPTDHPAASCETGSSFLIEKWDDYAIGQAPLQVQVQLLFKAIALEIGYCQGANSLLEESLISQFVPFRSPRFEVLPRKTESLEFARSLWRRILPAVAPRLIVCLGRDVQHELRKLIPKAMRAHYQTTDTFPTGWGRYTADVSSFAARDGSIRLLYLPHLSTWSLFTSIKCKDFIPAIIRSATLSLPRKCPA